MHKRGNDSTFRKDKLPDAMDHFQEPGHSCRLMRSQFSARSLRALGHVAFPLFWPRTTRTWGGGGVIFEGPWLKSIVLILQICY